MRMTSFLQNSKLFVICLALLLFQSCVTDKSRNKSIPDWSDIQSNAHNKTVCIAVESGIEKYSGNFTNEIKNYFKDYYGIDIQVDIIPSNHLSTAQYDIIYSTRSKINALYENNQLIGPFRDKLPNKQYFFWDTYFTQKSTDILDEYIATWGNVDVTFYRSKANKIVIPKTIIELEQIVIANPYRYTIGKGWVSLGLFSTLIEEVAKEEKINLSKYDRTIFNTLKEKMDQKLINIKSKFWRNGTANFNQIDLQSSLDLKKETTKFNNSEVVQKNQFFCLAVPNKAKNMESALFVINELSSPLLRMKRVNSILNEQVTFSYKIPDYIDSNYVIRYYDDFKYCSAE